MARKRAAAARYNVYVVELEPEVFTHRKFREANRGCDKPKACLYVGMTARTPDERFDNHKDGYKACRYVKKYGKWLVPRMYEKYNPLTYDDACAMELELADLLRHEGYAVWQK
jgi:hypothetical protein